MTQGVSDFDERTVEVKGEKVRLTAYKTRFKTQPWRAKGNFRGMTVEGKGRSSDEAFRDWVQQASVL